MLGGGRVGEKEALTLTLLMEEVEVVVEVEVALTMTRDKQNLEMVTYHFLLYNHIPALPSSPLPRSDPNVGIATSFWECLRNLPSQ